MFHCVNPACRAPLSGEPHWCPACGASVTVRPGAILGEYLVEAHVEDGAIGTTHPVFGQRVSRQYRNALARLPSLSCSMPNLVICSANHSNTIEPVVITKTLCAMKFHLFVAMTKI